MMPKAHAYHITIILLTVWVMTIPVRALGEESALTEEISVTAVSRYIDRGQELSRHSLVLQPSFTLSYGGFAVNVWGSWDSDPCDAGGKHWYETDYTLSYGGEFGIVTFESGYSYYDMNGYDDSQDIFLTLGLNLPLRPSLTVYREVGNDLYWYLVLTVNHSVPLTEKLAVDLSASAAYLASGNRKEYPEIDRHANETGRKFDNFHDGTLTISFPYTVSENVAITPFLSYTFPLCKEARREMEYFSVTGKDSTFLHGGVTFACNF